MDDVERWLFFVVFLVLGFFFSAVATALLSMNEGKMHDLIHTANLERRMVGRLFDASIQKKIIWMDLSHLICIGAALIIGTVWVFQEIMSTVTQGAPLASNNWLFLAMAVLDFIVMSCLVIAIGSLLPKKLFSRHSEQFLLQVYPFVTVVSYLFRPIVWIITQLSSGIAAIFGVKNGDFSDQITEAEIRSMVDAGEENGVIHQEECEMINNIFDFDDCMASDLMTHRTDVVAVDLNAKISEVVYYAINEGFSRIPVYENDIDNIKGVIYVKDLLCLVGCKSAEDFKINDFIRETIYVPEAKKCIDLFRIFKEKKIHLAVVVDEYGGTAGIISMEDMLESIVGNIQDEYDNEQEEIVKMSDNTYMLAGSIDLDDLSELFDIPFLADEDTDTLGGLIVETLGRIPDEGENLLVEINGIRFTVVLIEDRRIVKVKAELLTPIRKIEENESK